MNQTFLREIADAAARAARWFGKSMKRTMCSHEAEQCGHCDNCLQRAEKTLARASAPRPDATYSP